MFLKLVFAVLHILLNMHSALIRDLFELRRYCTNCPYAFVVPLPCIVFPLDGVDHLCPYLHDNQNTEGYSFQKYLHRHLRAVGCDEALFLFHRTFCRDNSVDHKQRGLFRQQIAEKTLSHLTQSTSASGPFSAIPAVQGCAVWSIFVGRSGRRRRRIGAGD